MAETLPYGYQRVVKCPECGLEFPVNCSREVEPQQGDRMPVTGCTCPGCRREIDFAKEEETVLNWKRPDWNSGDRVLVGKKLFGPSFFPPERLDIIVFDYPASGEGARPTFLRDGTRWRRSR